MDKFECGFGCFAWCGNPCKWDPEKRNGLIFKADGTEKSLKERGLGWDDPALKAVIVRDREKERALVMLRKVVGGKNPDRPIPGTEIGGTENRNGKSGTNFRSGSGVRGGRGRPKKEGSLSAAERKALWKARQKKGP